MSKIIRVIILLLLAVSLTACNEGGNGTESEPAGDDMPPTEFKMTAKIESIDEKIAVDVIESEYTTGPHLVITSQQTDFRDSNGKSIKKSDLSVGDTVEIFYSGQVMMSYPPQIVAAKIKKL